MAQPDSIDELTPREVFWRDHCQWLLESGYKLRPRYQPDWKPSWLGTDKSSLFCEDGNYTRHPNILDAVRVCDGLPVALKKIDTAIHPHEVDIAKKISAESMAKDPRNHCLPMLDTLQVPDEQNSIILVMTQLRPYHDPRFDTIGEAVECFRQLFEGLQFMHEHHVAHRDCNSNNIMMDATPMYPNGWHPCDIEKSLDWKGKAKHNERTLRPPKYYFVDFGISRQYDPFVGPPREYPIWGGDKTAPEFQRSDDPCDPFPTDVYYLGNMIRRDFLEGWKELRIPAKLGFEFMAPLVADMVHDDPTQRPTMDQVVARFEVIRRGLSTWKLRSRVIPQHRRDGDSWFPAVGHWFRRIRYTVCRIPPVPVT